MDTKKDSAKYPLVNGQFGFGIWGDFNASATMTLSSGSHIRIDRTDKTINGVWYINLSNGNENGYSPTSVTNINNKSTKFILNPGDNCTLKVTNIMSNSDAVFALMMIDEMFSLGLDNDAIASYAARLGSDCAFFLHDRPMFGSGRGEVLEEYDLPEGFDDEYEIKVLVPLIRRMGNKLVAMVSNTDSYLAQHSDHIVRATVAAEACPNNLAPTSSTTTQLVMGDAIAVCLLKMRGFSQEDFARYHPGGSLGKRLYLRVGDLIDPEVRPSVKLDETIQNTIINISQNRLGATVVLDGNDNLCGIITDGDVRRMVEKGIPIDTLSAKDIMSVNPKTIDINELAVNAFSIMEKNKITSVVVLREGRYVGLIHIHDILREGIV